MQQWKHESPRGGAGFSDGADSSTPKSGARNRGPSNLVPVRACDIHRMNDDEELLKIEGHECGSVTLVGIVQSIDIKASKATVLIDDRTGPWIEVQIWGDTNEVEELSSIGTGMYVRVIGNIRNQQEKQDTSKRIVVGYKIRPLTDLNELTFHLLDVLHTRIGFRKKDTKSEAMEVDGVNRMDALGGMTGYSGSDNFTRPQQLVFKLVKDAPAPGAHVRTIIERLEAHGVSRQQIKDALDFLMNEGHIYTTIDEETYKSIDP